MNTYLLPTPYGYAVIHDPMTNDTRTREHENTLDDVIALEDALEQKQHIKGQRTATDPEGLAARLHHEEAAERAERTRNLAGWERFLTGVKEFFGRGPEFEYRQQIAKVEQQYQQLTIVTKNLEESVRGIAKRKVTAEKQLILDEAEFQTNAAIAFHYERKLADVTALYESSRKETVSGIPSTTQAMESVQELTRLRQDLAEVHTENNTLAARIMSGREMVRNLEMQYDQSQRLYQGLEEQRVKAEGIVDLNKVHDNALKGVPDVKSITTLYKHLGAAAEQLTRMQKELKMNAIEKLPGEYSIQSPSASYKRVAGKQYWQTIDLFEHNGNGRERLQR